jgi:omega-hydroxy-beta-dihydromenaquinone-9 sulfotransferase
MHICWGWFLAAVWQTMVARPFVLSRFLLMPLLAAGFLAFELALSVCLAADWVFFRRFAKTPVSQPVFIVGNPRSGTSHLFRLMALDESKFTALRTYELLFPSLTQQWIISCCFALDRLAGSPGRRLVEKLEERFAAPHDHIRRSRLNEPEEDDHLLMHAFASPTLLMLLPHAKALAPLVRYDDLPAATRRRLERFYRRCLQRHLYRVNAGRLLLSKNVSFPAKIRSLHEFFPEARFIYILRNPVVSIASTQAMFAKAWGPRMGTDEFHRHQRRLLETSCGMYRHALLELERLPPDKQVIVEYESLVNRPVTTIRKIYDVLGMTVSNQYAERLNAAAEQARTFRSGHRYSVGEGGIATDEIRAALPEIFDRFVFHETGAIPPEQVRREQETR